MRGVERTKTSKRRGQSRVLLFVGGRQGGGPRRPSLQVEERPLLVAHDHVGQFVEVHVADHDLRANARVVVNQVRHPLDAVALTYELEPVDDRRGVRLGIAVAPVCPEALARDDVGEVVAIDIGQCDRMHL